MINLAGINFRKKELDQKVHDTPLRTFSFTEEILGEGGFSEVLLVHHGYRDYAVKRFNLYNDDDLHIARLLVCNTRTLAPLLLEYAPFVGIYAFSSGSSTTPWYLMEAIPGDNLSTLIKDSSLDEDLRRRSIHSYGLMLSFLHNKGKVCYDNKWSSIIYDSDRDTFRFVDIDLITTPQRGNILSAIFSKIYSCPYASREQLEDIDFKDNQNLERPHPFTADLESFAKMIDFISYGNTWVGFSDVYTPYVYYPKERREKLPQPLQEIVGELLAEQRNDAITIKDMMDAIEKL